MRLEAHLILWRGKYEFWIPSILENAIFYVNDEQKTRTGVPNGIETLIAKFTGSEIDLTSDSRNVDSATAIAPTSTPAR